MANKTHKPLPSSVRFFEGAIKNHTAIDSIEKVEDYVYNINRHGKPPLKILVADIYIASEADVFELNGKHPDLDCIVLIGFYNRYSWSAKNLAKTENIGLFDFREFFGAVNFVGQKLLDYEPKTKDN